MGCPTRKHGLKAAVQFLLVSFWPTVIPSFPIAPARKPGRLPPCEPELRHGRRGLVGDGLSANLRVGPWSEGNWSEGVGSATLARAEYKGQHGYGSNLTTR